jgi:hypothetical protein
MTINAKCRASGTGLRVWLRDAPADAFVVGANLPWIGYGTDFGANAWSPAGGLAANPRRLAMLDDTLGRLAADGVALVRVFVLCDLRSGIRFDAGALPIGVDDALFGDMDALIDTARRHSVRLIPVLVDFQLCHAAQVVNEVQVGGRSHLVTSGEGRSALMESVLAPVARRYGREDAIAAWDVMNEPEWCLRLAASRRVRDPFGALQTFLAAAVACVRANASQPVTVGSAGTWQLDLVRPLGLDFYQIHWYERFGWTRLAQPVTQFGLDHPVLLGEFSGRTRPVRNVIETARRAGYCGALVWSVLAEDDQSGYSDAFVSWAAQQPSGTGLGGLLTRQDAVRNRVAMKR